LRITENTETGENMTEKTNTEMILTIYPLGPDYDGDADDRYWETCDSLPPVVVADGWTAGNMVKMLDAMDHLNYWGATLNPKDTKGFGAHYLPGEGEWKGTVEAGDRP